MINTIPEGDFSAQLAEARFLRGHFYFELTKIYKYIPFIDEEMYAAQGGAEGANPGADQQGQPEANDAQGDNVEDVDFEEVK